MQKKSSEKFENENGSFIRLLEEAQNGDKNALENILIFLKSIYTLYVNT